MGKIVQIYNPVEFTEGSHKGETGVQVTNQEGRLLRDPQGSAFDDIGAWVICDKWSASQAAEYGRAIQSLKENCTVSVKKDGVTRIVTAYY